jgi:small subunit ribosomal protein S4e
MKQMKRQMAPKNWPIQRKGTTFVVKGDGKGVPILIALRDMLKISKNKKEVKKAIHKKEILISNKLPKDEKKKIGFLDTLTIIPSKKSYRLNLSEFGKFTFEEIKDIEKNKKISKIIDKKILKGKKIQLNLWDGRNFLFNEKCKVNDSVVIDLEKNKVEKCLPLKEDSSVIVIGGKHSGKKGKIKKIKEELKMVEIESDKKIFNILIKQLMVSE